MDSPHTGERVVIIGGQPMTLVYDWRAMAALRRLLDGGDVFEALASQDPETMAGVVAAGLARHHPEITAERVRDASPPLFPTLAAVAEALNWALWGPGGPPPVDPPQPAGT